MAKRSKSKTAAAASSDAHASASPRAASPRSSPHSRRGGASAPTALRLPDGMSDEGFLKHYVPPENKLKRAKRRGQTNRRR